MAGEEMGVQALKLLQQALWQMGGTPADQTGPESKRRRKSVTIPRTDFLMLNRDHPETTTSAFSKMR